MFSHCGTVTMTGPSAPHTQAAVQLLIWALEEIEKSGNAEAAQHARSALKACNRLPASPSIPPHVERDFA
jgi:hypothetical protein